MKSVVNLLPVSVDRIRPVVVGDTLGIFAPGSAQSPEHFREGIAEISKLGFQSFVPADPSVLFGRVDAGFGSESISRRLAVFNELLADNNVSALVSARGGYGTSQLLPEIDFDRVRAASKAIIGYSDLTPLLLNTVARAGLVSIHGPALALGFRNYSSSPEARSGVDALLRLLSDPTYLPVYSGTVQRPGSAAGPLLAGNLTLLQTMLATPYDVSFDGSILVVEDVAEAPYKVHRALLQLAHSGKFDALAGLAFGEFVNCVAPNSPDIDFVIQDFVTNIIDRTTFPVLKNLPVGHGLRNMPLPLGCRARIEGGELQLLESPIRQP